MSSLPQRKSPRLQGYDYSSSGAYFITICTYQRSHLLGEITDGEMLPSTAGVIAVKCWQAIPDHYADVSIDAFVVMPNHIHGILFLHTDKSRFHTQLGRVINAFKGAVTAQVRAVNGAETVVWQGRYHDHIIRSETELSVLRAYIEANPITWTQDQFYAVN